VSFKVNRSRSRLQRRRRRTPLSVVCRARAWRHEETASWRPAPNTFLNADALTPRRMESAVRGFRSQKPALWRKRQPAVVPVRLRRILGTVDIGSFPCASRRVANNCNRADIVHQLCVQRVFHVDMRPVQNTLQRIFHTHVHNLVRQSALVRWRRILRHSHLSLGLLRGRPGYYVILQPTLPGSTCKRDSALT